MVIQCMWAATFIRQVSNAVTLPVQSTLSEFDLPET